MLLFIPHFLKSCAIALIAWGFLLAQARADGGWICLQQTKAPYKITVFANPAPLRAGPVDFSVLVQDLESSQTVTDVDVALRVSPTFDIETSRDGQWLPPCCRLEANTLGGKATLGTGGNGLLYELRSTVSQPGLWKVEVTLGKNNVLTQVEGNLQVEKASPPWFVYWPYLALPLGGILFMGLNWMARRAKRPGQVLVGAEAI